MLAESPPALAIATLWELPDEKREAVLRSVPGQRREQWLRNHAAPAHSVGRLMEMPRAVFSPDQTVVTVLERMREIVRQALVTYGYVVDDEGRLVGVLIFRELVFAERDQPVGEVMLPQPFSCAPTWTSRPP